MSICDLQAAVVKLKVVTEFLYSLFHFLRNLFFPSRVQPSNNPVSTGARDINDTLPAQAQSFEKVNEPIHSDPIDESDLEFESVTLHDPLILFRIRLLFKTIDKLGWNYVPEYGNFLATH